MGFEFCERCEDKSTNRRSVEQTAVFPESVIRTSPGQHEWAVCSNITFIDLTIIANLLDNVIGPVAVESNLLVEVASVPNSKRIVRCGLLVSESTFPELTQFLCGQQGVLVSSE